MSRHFSLELESTRRNSQLLLQGLDGNKKGVVIPAKAGIHSGNPSHYCKAWVVAE